MTPQDELCVLQLSLSSIFHGNIPPELNHLGGILKIHLYPVKEAIMNAPINA
jgi:hypothetical protein